MNRCLLALVLIQLLVKCPCHAAEIWLDDETGKSISLDLTLKAGCLISRSTNSDPSQLDRWGRTGLARLRLDLDAELTRSAGIRIGYEHSSRWESLADGEFSGIFPELNDPPFRLSPLYSRISGDAIKAWFHEIDRLYLYTRMGSGEVSVGRQAIGLGRGRLFSAVDMFLPFDPVEVDREWRRGVDAIRVDYQISPRSSSEAILILGKNWDASALVIGYRGYAGNVDAEILAGKRGKDVFGAGVISSAVGNAEIHMELGVFRIPEPHPFGQIWGSDRLVPKLVVGGSHTFALGNGLSVVGEHHYSGFGAPRVSSAFTLFADPDWSLRLHRGDTQVLGRHASGLQATYPISLNLNAATTALVSPEDGSGVLSTMFRLDLSQAASITAAGYFSWGAKSRNGLPQSEFGSSPKGLFVQLAMYF